MTEPESRHGHRVGHVAPAPPPDPGGRLTASAAGWGLIGALLAIAAGMFASVVAREVTGELVVVLVVGQLVLWGGLIAVTVVISRRFGTGSLQRDYRLGVRARDLPIGLGVSILMRVAVVVVALAAMALLGEDFAVADQLEPFEAERTALVVALTLSVIGAPFVEELFFRGLLLRALERSWGAAPALVVQAVLFGLAHATVAGTAAENANLVAVLTATGLVLGLTARIAGRLGPAIIGHALFNLTTAVIVLAGPEL
jgi:uncharacterized protein